MTKRGVIVVPKLPELKLVHQLQEQLLGWFTINGRQFPWRRANLSNYKYIIAEVLLQRTRAETVANFYANFIVRYPSWKSLKSAHINELEEFLKPVGLWRRRAASIKKLANEMVKSNGRFPKNREQIEALPGVGQYITNSILLFCHGIPSPLLDVNMARVLERVFGPRKLADIRYDDYIQKLAIMVAQCDEPRAINWAVLDIASTICVIRNPSCKDCPLSSLCKTSRSFLD